jgi:antitoxin component of MazEF toxin-antitoxin module
LAPAAAESRAAATSRFSNRAITSPAFTREPSCTPSHSSRPVALVDTAALRKADTRPVAFSSVKDCVGYAVVTVAVSTAVGALAERIAIAAPITTMTSAPMVHLFTHLRLRRGGERLRIAIDGELGEVGGAQTNFPCELGNYTQRSLRRLELGAHQFRAREQSPFGPLEFRLDGGVASPYDVDTWIYNEGIPMASKAGRVELVVCRWGNSLAVRLPPHRPSASASMKGDKLIAEVSADGRLILAREGKSIDAAAIKSLRRFLAPQAETAPVVAKMRDRARY